MVASLMEIGIIGLPRSGKTTIFNALTRGNANVSVYTDKPNIGISKVPDIRLEKLAAMYKPQRVVQAEITYTDLPPPPEGSGNTRGIGGQHLNFLQSVDAILIVVREFEDSGVAHIDETIDPIRDAQSLMLELVISDLTIIDRRILKLEESLKGAKAQERESISRENTLLDKVKTELESGTNLNQQDLSLEEIRRLSGFGLLTTKPLVIVMNISENQLSNIDVLEQNISGIFSESNVRSAVVCADLEMDLSQMTSEEELEFRNQLGAVEPGLNKMVKLSYDVVGQISFFTVGEDEVRAWEIKYDTVAQKAAGKIHTDLEKGFIRAEVVTYEDLIELGSLSKARNNGVLRQEGKDYTVKDGDIMHVLFNV